MLARAGSPTRAAMAARSRTWLIARSIARRAIRGTPQCFGGGRSVHAPASVTAETRSSLCAHLLLNSTGEGHAHIRSLSAAEALFGAISEAAASSRRGGIRPDCALDRTRTPA